MLLWLSLFQAKKPKKRGPKFSEIDEQSLLYLSGYIAWKLQKKGCGKYGTISRDCQFTKVYTDKSWLAILSRGGLIVPDDHVQEQVRLFELEFRQLFDVYSNSWYCDRKLFHHI